MNDKVQAINFFHGYLYFIGGKTLISLTPKILGCEYKISKLVHLAVSMIPSGMSTFDYRSKFLVKTFCTVN